MELEINTRSLPLPSEIYLKNAISTLLQTNQSFSVMKKEIFDRIKIRMKEIIPILQMDFKMVRKLSIKNGIITEEDGQEIDKFLQDVKKIDVVNYAKEVVNKAFMKIEVKNECIGSHEEVKMGIIQWFQNYLNFLDRKIDEAVEVAMQMKHVEKCKIEKSLYNFTELKVDDKLLEHIENGIKNVPTIKKDGISVAKNALKEILNHLRKYRCVQQKQYPINHSET